MWKIGAYVTPNFMLVLEIGSLPKLNRLRTVCPGQPYLNPHLCLSSLTQLDDGHLEGSPETAHLCRKLGTGCKRIHSLCITNQGKKQGSDIISKEGRKKNKEGGIKVQQIRRKSRMWV